MREGLTLCIYKLVALPWQTCAAVTSSIGKNMDPNIPRYCIVWNGWYVSYQETALTAPRKKFGAPRGLHSFSEEIFRNHGKPSTLQAQHLTSIANQCVGRLTLCTGKLVPCHDKHVRIHSLYQRECGLKHSPAITMIDLYQETISTPPMKIFGAPRGLLLLSEKIHHNLAKPFTLQAQLWTSITSQCVGANRLHLQIGHPAMTNMW